MDERRRSGADEAQNDWIEWGGGDCPVDGNAQVEVRNAKGWVLSAPVFALKWHSVVAYRVVPA
ncbi:hypothetical protein I7G59_06360 [Sinorhizobium meliloti]|uniref:hypothetical protein n=1 Tax=Rhizobium meliloti TaxID=382 RepID=UPI0023807EF2|nr:hypothetical protein [Sinorhizobium meliloti]MDE3796956.1 hypothetical protein [Sinorhizobium meliloti]